MKFKGVREVTFREEVIIEAETIEEAERFMWEGEGEISGMVDYPVIVDVVSLDYDKQR